MFGGCFGNILGVFWTYFCGILGDIWGGVWGCFAGICDEFGRDLGGKHVLEQLKKKNVLIKLCYFLIRTLLNTPYAYDKNTPNFAQGLDFLRFQVAIYTVVHEESESEVEKCRCLEPGGKK